MRLVFFVFALCFDIGAARAQFPIQFPVEPPAQIVRAALEHPFGQLLMTEFAKSVAQNADAKCLQSKGLDAAALRDRGRELFQKWGTASMETIAGVVDMKRYEASVTQRAGRNAVAELGQLREDAVVRQYLAIERPFRLARVLNFIVEQFDRYVLLNRIKFTPISPTSSGKDELLRADPSEAAEEAMEKFIANNKSARFTRFYELSAVAGEALNDALDLGFALKWGPSTFYRGVENDLAELCVGKR